ncbi:putative MFS family arabinose efflux permease [Bradyrhizobium macuxiense]|uniref:Putative MFS family arabinose efflux permease n=1 Tax=Bradyrhizobium macuxiense TaxID=1755647 RepID=A0A560KXS0_9BRAD|nr:MFS transporter [Bradyrhizobium macuxiense]TWB86894.1 putative MFS family arabinose efflux permease [Bradyrhizobium macuxiense]
MRSRSNATRTGSIFSAEGFLYYSSAQIISNIGTWTQRLAQDWLALAISNNNSYALAVTVAMQTVPIVLFGVFAGSLADKNSKNLKRAIIGPYLMNASALVALGISSLLRWVDIYQIFAVAFIGGMATAFAQPARTAIVYDIVGPAFLPKAVSINSIIFNSSKIIGPMIAGYMLVFMKPGWAFILNGLSYVISAVMVVAIKLKRRSNDRADGLVPRRGGLVSYVLSRPKIMVILAMVALVSAFAQNGQLVLPFIVKENFDGDVRIYGYLTSTMAVGSIAAAFAYRNNLNSMNMMFGVCLLIGIAQAAMSAAAYPALLFLAIAAVGFLVVIMNISTNSALQLAVGDGMRAQVMALFMTANISANAAGAIFVAAMIQRLGAYRSLFICALATLILSILLFAIYRLNLQVRPSR